VHEDLEHLRRIDDDGVDLLDQASPCGAALLGRDGQLAWRLFGGTCMNGETPRMVALPPLGGHLCLMGDVPAGLLAFGRHGEVAAQWENVQAMVDTGRKRR